jgi:hypothetical protein
MLSTGTAEFRKRLFVNATMPRNMKMPSTRELIDTGTDKRYVRRNKKGQFKESDDVGRSLAADRRKKAKTVAKPGQGDQGDRRADRG